MISCHFLKMAKNRHSRRRLDHTKLWFDTKIVEIADFGHVGRLWPKLGGIAERYVILW